MLVAYPRVRKPETLRLNMAFVEEHDEGTDHDDVISDDGCFVV